MVQKKLWPACLPDLDRDFLGETAFVAGWGITKTRVRFSISLHIPTSFAVRSWCTGRGWR